MAFNPVPSLPPPSRPHERGGTNTRWREMIPIGDGVYAPSQTSFSYPYPVGGTKATAKMDNASSSQTLLLGNGLAAPPQKYPIRPRRPPPLTLHKRSQSAMTFSTTSNFSSTKGLSSLSRFNPFAKSEVASYESLNDVEEKGDSSASKKIRRKSTTAGGLSRGITNGWVYHK